MRKHYHVCHPDASLCVGNHLVSLKVILKVTFEANQQEKNHLELAMTKPKQQPGDNEKLEQSSPNHDPVFTKQSKTPCQSVSVSE